MSAKKTINKGTNLHADDFRIVRTNLLENGNATTHGRLVPYTVFIDPQLRRIGLSETEARSQGCIFACVLQRGLLHIDVQGTLMVSLLEA